MPLKRRPKPPTQSTLARHVFDRDQSVAMRNPNIRHIVFVTSLFGDVVNASDEKAANGCARLTRVNRRNAGMESTTLWARGFSSCVAAAWLMVIGAALQPAQAQGFVWPPHPPPPPVFNPSAPYTVPNAPQIPVSPGPPRSFPNAEPCSVFDSVSCFPQLLPPIGQDLRLTIVSTDDEAAAAMRNAADNKSGGEADHAAGEKTLDSIRAMYAALRACWIPPSSDAGRRGMEYTIRFAFTGDGAIMAPPRRTYSSHAASEDVRNTYADAVDAALKRCTPLHFSAGMASAVAGRPISVRFVDERTLGKSFDEIKSKQ
jgi:hypothetical protein